jgi:hypothetical protein
MSSPSPNKPKWSARMGSVMRRTSSVLTISRPTSAASERDTDNSSLTSSTRARANSNLSSPLIPAVITPSPIAESPLRDAAAEVQEAAGPSPLAKPITSPEVVPPTLPPAVEETQSPTGYMPPSVIDSTAGNSVEVLVTQDPTGYIPPDTSTVRNPGAFTDFIGYQPYIAQEPQAVAPVEPHVEPKDLEPMDHTDNAAEFSEAVYGNANAIWTDPFADPVAPRITISQPVLDMPQYVNLELPTVLPTPTNSTI